jgi:hypothetical protein
MAEAQAIRLGEGDGGYGWVVFAGVMLTLGGTLKPTDGIGAGWWLTLLRQARELHGRGSQIPWGGR